MERHASMRILIATDSFPPKIDGVADTSSILCAALTRRGHHVTVIAPGPGASEERGAHVLRLAAVPMPFYREVRLVHQLRTLRQLTKRLDVQAAIVLTLGPVGLGVTKWLPPAVRLIHVYTTDMPAYVRAYRAGFLVPVVDEVTRRVARRADATLVPTPMIGQGLAEARVPRLMTWARGVDTSLFHPSKYSADTRSRLTMGEPSRALVLYAGRLAREKRLLDLLEATRRLPEARFAFVGDGPQRAELERLFPPQRTVFTGYLRGAALAEAFASADVFAFPSDSDTFGQVVLQSMASGVPPVVIRGSAPATLVKHGENGLVIPARSPGAMADAIERLTIDSGFRRRLAAQATQDAGLYSWEVLVDELEGLLRAAPLTRRDAGELVAGVPMNPSVEAD